jgi:hypothetical protein
MEKWRIVLREGIFPLASTVELQAGKLAVENDFPELLQSATTSPPPVQSVQNWPCEGACFLAYIGWRGLRLSTVGEVEEYFAKFCFEIDDKLGEPAACRWFLDWFDKTPRKEVLEQLQLELDQELTRRDI